MKLKPCPVCGGKAIVNPFVFDIAKLPKPIKLFGGWSLIKMRYREIPINYIAECENFCNPVVGDTKQEAIEAWNGRVDDETKAD